MKKLILCAFVAASTLVAPGALITASGALAQIQCGPDSPAEWQRPGGFCDQSESTKSLTDQVTPGEGCTPVPTIEVTALAKAPGERVHVAVSCEDPCELLPSSWKGLPAGVRLHLAEVVCGA